MSIYNGPSITNSGLLLNIDAGNPKSYSTRENLLPNSVNPTSWYTTNMTVVPNATIAPDGTLTASQYLENSAVNVIRGQGYGVPCAANSMFLPYTASIYIKNNSRTCFSLDIKEYGTYSQQAYASFDVANNVILTTYTGGGAVVNSATITRVNNGWSRCVLTATLNSAQTSIGFETAMIANTVVGSIPYNFAYTGDGASNLYIWGPQLERNNVATNYSVTTGTSIQKSNTWIDVSGRGYAATINTVQVFSTPFGGGITTPANQVTTSVSMPIQALQSLTDGTVYTMEWTLTVLSGTSGIRYGPHMTIAGGNEFIWVYDGSGLNCYLFNSSRDIGSDPTFAFDVPMTLTVTRNGLTYRVYKNGVFTAQYTNLTGNFDAKQVQSWVLDQEQDAVGTGFDLNQNLNANWHNVKLYDKILSDEEILQNFIANRGRYGL